jgi:hypothetical protein
MDHTSAAPQQSLRLPHRPAKQQRTTDQYFNSETVQDFNSGCTVCPALHPPDVSRGRKAASHRCADAADVSKSAALIMGARFAEDQ